MKIKLNSLPPSDNSVWQKGEVAYLVRHYPHIGKMACAEHLGRSEASIRGMASKLGLRLSKNSSFYSEFHKRTGIALRGRIRPKHAALMKQMAADGRLHIIGPKTEADKRRISTFNKQWIKENGHPRGMLGKTQTDKCKGAVSEASKKRWADPNSKQNSREFRQHQSDIATKMINERIRNRGSVYSRANNGWYNIKGVAYYFRSGWEVNYARYLEFLKDNGKISKWEYEPDTFWFEKIKRGVRSYTPDFKVFNLDGTFEYHEVKGWMDKKSATKLKRMGIYHPQIKMVLIDKSVYKSILEFERLYPDALGTNQRHL